MLQINKVKLLMLRTTTEVEFKKNKVSKPCHAF
jgi:hypothetical protein